MNTKILIKHHLLFMQILNIQQTNFQDSTTAKVGKHIPSGFSKSTIRSFKSMKNKHRVYRGKDCMNP